ncbi:hypothetical protein L0222_19405 [bacterium]|nr:hypothetical protein [bacterium]
MSKLPKEEVEKIIKKSLKGYRLREETPAETDTSATRVSPDSGGLDLKALRKKYLRTDSVQEPATGEDAVEDEIVIVEPEGRAPLDRGARGKAVVVSGKKKKIIGQQG